MSLSSPLVSLALFLSLSAFPPPAPAGAAAAALRACDQAYLGVYVAPADEGGATVTRLMPGSPAEALGLELGDRIVSLGHAEVGSPEELTEAVAAHEAGDEVELVLHRGGDQLSFSVRLGNRAEAEARGDFQDWQAEEAPELPGSITWESAAPALRLTPASPRATPSVRFQPEPRRAEGAQHLEQRLDELRQRMDERFEDLSRRLQELREERAESGLDERLSRFQAELEADREAQQRRVEELRSALRREAQDREARAEPGATSPFGLFSQDPAGGGPPAASAREIQALREEVRTLREEIRELKELITR
jgi:hypothetical protein